MILNNAMSLAMMVKGQLATNGIHNDRIIDALCQVDRACFVPEAFSRAAYVDQDIPLGHGRYLLEPLLFARLLTHADIQRGYRVLDIGAGLGYSSAVIAELTTDVVAIEAEQSLVISARQILASLSQTHVNMVCAPLLQGCADFAPYDRIIIEGALETVPSTIEDQLAEGGQVIGLRFVSERFVTQRGLASIIIGTKHHNRVTYVEKERVSAYPLCHNLATPSFIF
jgi:protein-L-isoaspartate(D-aspartate) O-methyltransferase